LEPAKRDALVAVLKPAQRRSSHAESSRKLRVRRVTAAFVQKFAKLTLEWPAARGEPAQSVIPDVEYLLEF
jgi:hypothetical protein